MSPPQLLFNIILKVLANTTRQEKEIKGIQIGKEDITLSLFTGDMIMFVENLNESTNKLLELISDHSKVARYKVNIQKSIVFLDAKNEEV